MDRHPESYLDSSSKKTIFLLWFLHKPARLGTCHCHAVGDLFLGEVRQYEQGGIRRYIAT